MALKFFPAGKLVSREAGNFAHVKFVVHHGPEILAKSELVARVQVDNEFQSMECGGMM